MVLFGRATYVQWSGQAFDLIDIDSGGLTVTTEAIPIPKYGTSVIEYAPGYTDYGSISVTIGTDTGATIAALRQMHEANTVAPLIIVLANGLEIDANAFITNFGDTVDKHGLYTVKLTFKLSGKATTKATTANIIILPPTNTRFFRGGSYTLSLSGNSAAYAMFGGNATFSLVDPVEKVTITDNLLIIDEAALPGTFKVQATMNPTGGTDVKSITPVTYSIVVPNPTTITVNGDATIEAPAGTAPYEKTYVVEAYPSGSDSAVTWKLYKFADGQWKEVEVNDHISIGADNGKVTLTKDYQDHELKNFMIQATSTVVPSLVATKQISAKRLV